MAVVYILYSGDLGRYYTGSCLDLQERLAAHRSKTYNDSFTAKADDWTLFYECSDLGYGQAREIERHIKRMKSRKYIENLGKYPEIMERLKALYGVD